MSEEIYQIVEDLIFRMELTFDEFVHLLDLNYIILSSQISQLPFRDNEITEY